MIQFRGLSIGRGRGLMAIAAETGQRYGDEVRGRSRKEQWSKFAEDLFL
jgi:hypothetical protein